MSEDYEKGLRKRISELTAECLEVENDVSEAYKEINGLKAQLAKHRENMPLGEGDIGPHEFDPANCPSFHDACHCTVDTLIGCIDALDDLQWVKITPETMPKKNGEYAVTDGNEWWMEYWGFVDHDGAKGWQHNDDGVITHFKFIALPKEKSDE